MHMHGTSQAARRCSTSCGANQMDHEYYEKHRHYREAPRDDCLACKDLKHKAEERRREETTRARAASKCTARGENPIHHNHQLRLGLRRQDA